MSGVKRGEWISIGVSGVKREEWISIGVSGVKREEWISIGVSGVNREEWISIGVSGVKREEWISRVISVIVSVIDTRCVVNPSILYYHIRDLFILQLLLILILADEERLFLLFSFMHSMSENINHVHIIQHIAI